MQSLYHNVPVINGNAQREGGRYRAADAQFAASKKRVDFSVNIAGAYPDEAAVENWIRTYSLQRGKQFVINDSYRLTDAGAVSRMHFMTDLACRVEKPEVMELEGADVALSVAYDPARKSTRLNSSH